METIASDEMVLSSVQKVLNDFEINSSVATAAQQIARTFIEWSKRAENKAKFKKFSDEVIQNLETVFTGTVKSNKATIINRDKLWRNFFLLRSSTSYRKLWEDFLEPILSEKSSSALFYQHVTGELFKQLVKSHFQVENNSKDAASLSDQEGNALRYAAGYVCRHLRKKIENSTHNLKEELIICLMTLVKGVQYPEGTGTNEQWTDSLDRGGLWHVRENTYHFFCALEEETQIQLRQLAQSAFAARKRMIEAIISNEDVQFYWLILSADFEVDDDEVQSILLTMITELYLTMRGFSFANNWVEKFKQATKRSTQKSKSLRRELGSQNQIE